MLQELFYWIFNMSITATITGILIILIRMVKKIPRRFIVLLWIIPFLRMVFPFGFDSPYSLMSLLKNTITKSIVVYQPTSDVSFSMMNSIQAADTYFPVSYKDSMLNNVFSVASVIWTIIAFAILLMLAFTYFTTLLELKGSEHLNDNVFISKKVTSPAVYGIVKPRIILPESYKDSDNEFVLLHEKAHIRSADNLWRFLAIMIFAIHWFNPLCWIFLRLFLTDIELACDERVLIKLGHSRKKEYALFLLETKQDKNIFVSAFGGAKIRTRIENILSFKKLTLFSIMALIILFGIVFYVLLTNAG